MGPLRKSVRDAPLKGAVSIRPQDGDGDPARRGGAVTPPGAHKAELARRDAVSGWPTPSE